VANFARLSFAGLSTGCIELMGTLTLKKQAVRGVLWTVLSYGTSQVLRFGSNLLLTRLLAPEFFGLMALVNIFVVGLRLFSDVGIGLSIVQNKRGEDPDFINTAWTIQVMRGFGLWLICLMIAYPLSLLYNPQLMWLLPVVGLSTIFDGFASTAPYTLERRIALSRLTLLEISTQVLQISVMLLWGYFSPTIWALVVGGVVASAVRMVCTHKLVTNYKNRFLWEWDAAGEIFSFGRWIFLSTAVTFLAEQADRLLLGKLFSLELLGVYGVALMLSDVPRQVALALSHRVVLPAAAKLVHLPRPELRSKILKHRKVLLTALMLAIAVLAGFGDRFICFLYDSRYADAAWMLPLLALGIWPRLMCATIETSLYAINKMQYTTTANCFRLFSTVFGIGLGYTLFKVPGAVIAVALNDLFYYSMVNYGLYREGLSGFKQDLRITAELLVLLGSMMLVRDAIGWGMPLEGMAKYF
jgi:O-antigen/teichoic acid export membrane protein